MFPVERVLKRPYDELIILACKLLVVKRLEIAVEKVERGIINDDRPYETILLKDDIPASLLRDDSP
jgi:hypothetical protein